MNAPEFIELVRRMRAAQRDHFSYRDPESLQLAKDLAIQVDAAIFELLGAQSLFDRGAEEVSHGK